MTVSPPEPTRDAGADAEAVGLARLAADLAEANRLLLRVSAHFIHADHADLGEACDAALATLGRHAGASTCYLFEFDEAGRTASMVHDWRAVSVPSTRHAFQGVTAAELPTLLPAATAGKPLQANDLADLGPDAEVERRLLESLGVGAFITVPVKLHGRAVGLLGYDHRGGGRVWTDAERRPLAMAADLFAQALDRRRTRDRLAFHVANAPLGVIEWDNQWRLRRWSGRAAELFGWDADEVLGRAWAEWRFVHPDDVPAVRGVTERLVDGTESANVSVNRNFTKAGDVITCEWFNSVLRDSTGRVESILSFVQDVTRREATAARLIESEEALRQANAHLEQRVERRTAELRETADALRESEARFRQLAEHATDMISRHDETGRFTYVSPACRRILGYEPDELIGQRPRVIAHPDDRQAVIDSLPRLRATDDVVSTTFRATRKDGRVVWLEASSRDEGGTIVVVSRDVTDRREAEDRLRLVQSAVDQVGEAVVITDADLQRPGPRIVYVNPAFTAITGYRLDDVAGLSPRVLQGPDTDHAVLDELRAALAAGRPFTGETVNYRKDGGKYAVEWNINPLRDAADRIINWVAIQRDVTDRRDAEQLARLHREELAHVTRLSAMGELASGLAHELNQPLAAIANYAHGLEKRLDAGRADPAAVRDAVHHLADQADRAARVVKRVRAFVVKRGTVRAPESINHLLRETLALARAEAADRGVRLEARLADGLPDVHVDRIQIEQVLLNLIRNGLEAMDMDGRPPEDKVLTVATAAIRDGKPAVQVTVTDRGPGLRPGVADHLFDPFFTTKDGGMGMGLTISQSIVQAHDGRLWASPPGDPASPGTTFHLTLPAAAPLT
ncbi:MAG: PAS domain S-box protein [Planctomycetota bacterium]